MSIAHVARVLGGLEVKGDTHVSADRARLVLAKLADYANSEGIAWPAKDNIAAAICIPRGSVTYALTVLIEQGLIEPVEKRSGGRWPTKYRLILNDQPATHVDGSTGHTRGRLEDEQPATHETPTGHTRGPQPATHVATNHQEPPPTPKGGGGGGEGLTPPPSGRALAPSERAHAVLTTIRAELPQRVTADLIDHVLLGHIETALDNGAQPEQIVAAATTDVPGKFKHSCTGWVASRIKDAGSWIVPTSEPVDAPEPEPEHTHEPADGITAFERTDWRQDQIDMINNTSESLSEKADEFREIWGDVIPGGGDLIDLERRCEEELGCAIWNDDGPEIRAQHIEGEVLYTDLRVLDELDDDELYRATQIAKEVHQIAIRQRNQVLRREEQARVRCDQCDEEMARNVLDAHVSMRHPIAVSQ